MKNEKSKKNRSSLAPVDYANASDVWRHRVPLGLSSQLSLQIDWAQIQIQIQIKIQIKIQILMQMQMQMQSIGVFLAAAVININKKLHLIDEKPDWLDLVAITKRH